MNLNYYSEPANLYAETWPEFRAATHEISDGLSIRFNTGETMRVNSHRVSRLAAFSMLESEVLPRHSAKVG